jgi:hypothetical protein
VFKKVVAKDNNREVENMKNVKKILFALLLIVGINKVSAVEYTYSEWSQLYPSGMDELLIESEVRYKWYTFNPYRHAWRRS